MQSRQRQEFSKEPTMSTSTDQRSADSVNSAKRRWGNPRQQQQAGGTADTATTLIMTLITLYVSALLVGVQSAETPDAWRLIQRNQWHARVPLEVTNFTGPAPYLIIHHSYQPGVCLTKDACKAAMRSMQNFHMDERDWEDIGYSFAVGGDGNVYEGRGFGVVGAHTPHYNNCSIGLLLIGNFVEKLPPAPMLQVARSFIEYAVEEGHLQADYILYGHRQVRDTQCPGAALYAEMKTWPHWQKLLP